MAQRELLSQREEIMAPRLTRNQPESAKALLGLTEKVKARTIQVVLKDRKVAEQLKGTRWRVVGVDLKHEQPKETPKSTRWFAVVGIYDYDRNILVTPIVDLKDGVIVGIEERERLQPPLTPEEVEECRKIVLSSPQSRSLNKHSGLKIISFPARAASSEDHLCYKHRCFNVYFWTSGGRPKKVAQAVVDLSTRQLIPWSEAQPFALQREGH